MIPNKRLKSSALSRVHIYQTLSHFGYNSWQEQFLYQTKLNHTSLPYETRSL